MRLTQEWLYGTTDVALRFAQVSAHRSLVCWLAVTIHGPLHEYTSRKGQPALTHRGGRNNAQLLGHDASWTRHSTAQPRMLPAAISPAPAPAMRRHNSPLPSGQSQQRFQAVHRRSRPPGHLFTTQQPCSMPQPTLLAKPQ
jgi:hypothetical protein